LKRIKLGPRVRRGGKGNGREEVPDIKEGFQDKSWTVCPCLEEKGKLFLGGGGAYVTFALDPARGQHLERNLG